MKKIIDHTSGTPFLEKLFRAGIHVPVGLANVFFLYVGSLFGILFFAGFFMYELSEDWSIKDKAYLDIFGWLVGFALGIAGLFMFNNLQGW